MLQKGVHVPLKFIIKTLTVGEGKDKLVPIHALKA